MADESFFRWQRSKSTASDRQSQKQSWTYNDNSCVTHSIEISRELKQVNLIFDDCLFKSKPRKPDILNNDSCSSINTYNIHQDPEVESSTWASRNNEQSRASSPGCRDSRFPDVSSERNWNGPDVSGRETAHRLGIKHPAYPLALSEDYKRYPNININNYQPGVDNVLDLKRYDNGSNETDWKNEEVLENVPMETGNKHVKGTVPYNHFEYIEGSYGASASESSNRVGFRREIPNSSGSMGQADSNSYKRFLSLSVVKDGRDLNLRKDQPVDMNDDDQESHGDCSSGSDWKYEEVYENVPIEPKNCQRNEDPVLCVSSESVNDAADLEPRLRCWSNLSGAERIYTMSNHNADDFRQRQWRDDGVNVLSTNSRAAENETRYCNETASDQMREQTDGGSNVPVIKECADEYMNMVEMFAREISRGPPIRSLNATATDQMRGQSEFSSYFPVVQGYINEYARNRPVEIFVTECSEPSSETQYGHVTTPNLVSGQKVLDPYLPPIQEYTNRRGAERILHRIHTCKICGKEMEKCSMGSTASRCFAVCSACSYTETSRSEPNKESELISNDNHKESPIDTRSSDAGSSMSSLNLDTFFKLESDAPKTPQTDDKKTPRRFPKMYFSLDNDVSSDESELVSNTRIRVDDSSADNEHHPALDNVVESQRGQLGLGEPKTIGTTVQESKEASHENVPTLNSEELSKLGIKKALKVKGVRHTTSARRKRRRKAKLRTTAERETDEPEDGQHEQESINTKFPDAKWVRKPKRGKRRKELPNDQHKLTASKNQEHLNPTASSATDDSSDVTCGISYGCKVDNIYTPLVGIGSEGSAPNSNDVQDRCEALVDHRQRKATTGCGSRTRRVTTERTSSSSRSEADDDNDCSAETLQDSKGLWNRCLKALDLDEEPLGCLIQGLKDLSLRYHTRPRTCPLRQLFPWW